MTTTELSEFDEAGNLVSTYIESAGKAHGSRVDVVVCLPGHRFKQPLSRCADHEPLLQRPKDTKSLWQKLLDVFLPAGYPQSVTDDYTEYQIFDSLQAFSSSIAGLLSNRAVLEGVGVGDASTTPTAALLLTILQETTGRLATIFFAHRLGTSLEPECKMYRLSADVFNDCAMVLDCLNPALPGYLRVGAMCGAGVMRAMCGVAAGSSKASLSKHFARWGNLGELNAKDSSQETVISLLGTLAGTLVISRITSPAAVWSSLLLLLAIHLLTNTLAVRAVRLRTLNRQRANLVFSHLLAAKDAWRDAGVERKGAVLKVPTPAEISRQEQIFCLPGWRLRYRLPTGHMAPLGQCHIGVGLHQILACFAKGRSHRTGAMTVPHDSPGLSGLMKVFKHDEHVLWHDGPSRTNYIALKRGATAEAALKAWFHGFLVAVEASQRPRELEGHRDRKGDGAEGRQIPLMAQSDDASGTGLELLESTLGQVNAMWTRYAKALREARWDLDEGALETRSGVRVAW